MSITAMENGQLKTAAFNGASIDISGITGDVTIFVRFESLTPGKNAVLQIQDSVDAFATNRVVAEFAISGSVDPRSDVTLSQRLYQNKMLRSGVAGAVLRAALAYIDGSATVQYSAWIQS